MYTGPARFESNPRVEADMPLTYKEQPPEPLLGTVMDDMADVALLDSAIELITCILEVL
jgi:hypothetical protein